MSLKSRRVLFVAFLLLGGLIWAYRRLDHTVFRRWRMAPQSFLEPKVRSESLPQGEGLRFLALGVPALVRKSKSSRSSPGSEVPVR